MSNKGFANLRDWLIALAVGCGLVLIPYFVHAEERYFALKAGNDWGLSEMSKEVSADIPEGAGCTLNWNKAEGASFYVIFWGKAPGEYIPPEGIPLGNETSHIFVRPSIVTNITVIQ